MAALNIRLRLASFIVFLVLSSFISNTVLAKKNLISVEPEQGRWKVRKFKNGITGACFESHRVLIIVFRKPGVDETSIKLVFKKRKAVSNPQTSQKDSFTSNLLVQGDTICFAFDSVLPSGTKSHRWDNILVQTIPLGNMTITTTSLAASPTVLKRMKGSRQLFIFAGTAEDIDVFKFAIILRIPLNGALDAIVKSLQ